MVADAVESPTRRRFPAAGALAAASLAPGAYMLHRNRLEPGGAFRLIDFLERSAGPGAVER